MTSAQRPTVLVLSMLLLSVSPSEAQTPSPGMSGPVVSVFAGGNLGPGGWILDIDPSFRVKTKMIGESDSQSRARQLGPEERQRLLGLVAALPTERPRYDFGNPGAVDASVMFSLTVGIGKETRRYVVMHPPYETRDQLVLKPVLSTLQFLRGLLKSTVAHNPPQAEASPK